MAVQRIIYATDRSLLVLSKGESGEIHERARNAAVIAILLAQIKRLQPHLARNVPLPSIVVYSPAKLSSAAA